MSKIIGLDLGTSSIGWAVIDSEEKKIVAAGSRIIPMGADEIADFQKGKLKSAASERTAFRGHRRLYERANLRRERLLKVLNEMNFLPKHFADAIDFSRGGAKYKKDLEPLLPYYRDENGKSKFIFEDSFDEMVSEFRIVQPNLPNDKLIPRDWTLYYLRKKALREKILPQELAWILLNFNAKRGYYQRATEEVENEGKEEEYTVVTIERIEVKGENKKQPGTFFYDLYFNDGGIKTTPPAKQEPYKVGDKVEVIRTTKKSKSETTFTYRMPKEDDWTLMKKRSESLIEQSGLTVGEFIYDALLNHPDEKVIGKLVRVVERKFYKEELVRILKKQCEYHEALNDKALLARCADALYVNNSSHANELKSQSFLALFVNDIIFYHRPLKSKKSEISDCRFEIRNYGDKETGEIKSVPVKCVPKSHPLFQRFRLLEFVQNLKIIQRENNDNGKIEYDKDVTSLFIKDVADLNGFVAELSKQEKISQDSVLKVLLKEYKGKTLKEKLASYRWNYPEDKVYPGLTTRLQIEKRLAKCGIDFELTDEKLEQLWLLLYNISDNDELQKAITTFASKNVAESDAGKFVDAIKSVPSYPREYAAYSQKAIAKIYEKMLQGMNRSDACRELYGRDSEAGDMSRWTSPRDMDIFIKLFMQNNEMRNPVVQAIIGETLRVVRDLWARYGNIDEIHVEMGRDLKNPADKRKADMERNAENEMRNLRVKMILQELANSGGAYGDVRPQSPMQQDIFKIFEEGVTSTYDIPEDLMTIYKDLGDSRKHVSHNDVVRYVCWLEQKYQSPYTGRFIPLSKLFSTEYEIEHVIPRSRYFDDSLSNKVICESAVNKLKSNMLAHEFIAAHAGEVVTLSGGENVTVFTVAQYEDFVKTKYAKNKAKRNKLLLDDVPNDFNSQQLNNARYIARKTCELLSKLVRQSDEETELVSRRILSSNGKITDRLKKDWGLNDVWNQIVAPRFIRMNEITGSDKFGSWVNKEGKQFFMTDIPLEYSRGFSKKRIDHRHHAMDAIVIACASRNIVNFINNENARDAKLRYDLRNKLCTNHRNDATGDKQWLFIKPWETFTQDVLTCLDDIVVSFKQDKRILTKTTNYYQCYVKGKKVMVKQTKGDLTSVRKSLHKETFSGKVRIQEIKTVKLLDALQGDWHLIVNKEVRKAIKEWIIANNNTFDAKAIAAYFKKQGNKVGDIDVKKVAVYYTPSLAETSLYATRKALDDSFNKKRIEQITDTGIRKILLAHLAECGDDTKVAFSPEGIALMNKNISKLNGGKDHKPITKVRVYEESAMNRAIGEKSAKTTQYVQAAAGTNLFFAIYVDENGKRIYKTIPLRDAIECKRMTNNPVPANDENGNKLLFYLSPGDLVYVPNEDEHIELSQLDRSRIYKMVSCGDYQCFFVPATIASSIVDKNEFSSKNKMEKTIYGVMIKNCCVKLDVNRLGEITKIIGA